MTSLKNSFLIFCEKNNFEINNQQVEIVTLLDSFFRKKSFFSNIFINKHEKKCYYLFGGVGVGKTMVLNFLYDNLNVPKYKIHFNEFMINFYDFRHKRKNNENSLSNFVQELKKFKLIYLDEFQVTNIVDAMILGKLFEEIFKEDIKLILTSNTKINELYKDGLQREQFLPFISIIKNNSIQKELILENDYRKIGPNKLQRAFYPINKKNIFQVNQIFRKLTKNRINNKININIKGRSFVIFNFFEGIARFDFKELCDVNIGAEDYVEIAKKCEFIVIDCIPKFNDQNSNQQNRFITLIDILYEKKIPLMISIATNFRDLGTSSKLEEPFKRTLSRLYELTSPNINI